MALLSFLFFMKTPFLLLALASLAVASVSAASAKSDTTATASLADQTAAPRAEDAATSPSTDAALIAEARATYPLDTCIVSGETLGARGEAVGHIHRLAGQPDRVVFLCCGGCTDDFTTNSTQLLAKLDTAKP